MDKMNLSSAEFCRLRDFISLDFFIETLPRNAEQFRSLDLVSPGPAQCFLDARLLELFYALRKGQVLRALDQHK